MIYQKKFQKSKKNYLKFKKMNLNFYKKKLYIKNKFKDT